MQFYEINICQIVIFKVYSAYNKHEIMNIGNKTREKPEINFAADCKVVYSQKKSYTELESL